MQIIPISVDFLRVRLSSLVQSKWNRMARLQLPEILFVSYVDKQLISGVFKCPAIILRQAAVRFDVI